MYPNDLGYYFPAEWEKHDATWLTWPYLDDSFPGRLKEVIPAYIQFIKQISRGEKVRLIVPEPREMDKVKTLLIENNIDLSKIEFLIHPTNDVWCRDHGPAFIINSHAQQPKAIVNWQFNAWGGKYPSELDNMVPLKVANYLNLPVFEPGIIMEGGSVDFNGNGTLITTESCLLNPNRNPHLTRSEIEQFLIRYYGVQQVLWLKDGIVGDDTDGHVDDITRFVNAETVITAIETRTGDENFEPLQQNLKLLKSMRLLNGKQLNIIELPMPDAVYYDDRRLPASYANFYICNSAVIVPVFRCKNDNVALKIIEEAFPDRPVYDIDSYDIICGLGSFHCLSQQEPRVEQNKAPH